MPHRVRPVAVDALGSELLADETLRERFVDLSGLRYAAQPRELAELAG